MGSTPLVSIVTPFYNTRDFLAECIESVLRQTYQNWELRSRGQLQQRRVC